jgi:hypothetical protein
MNINASYHVVSMAAAKRFLNRYPRVCKIEKKIFCAITQTGGNSELKTNIFNNIKLIFQSIYPIFRINPAIGFCQLRRLPDVPSVDNGPALLGGLLVEWRRASRVIIDNIDPGMP